MFKTLEYKEKAGGVPDPDNDFLWELEVLSQSINVSESKRKT
jgi:hypothetical protein